MISLNRSLKTPLYEQLYQQLRDEISHNHIKAAERLVSTREMAKDLQVSRNTVELAYAQLCAEGYLDNRPGSGYYVNEINLDSLQANQAIDQKTIRQSALAPVNDTGQHYRYNLQYGISHIDDFPLKKWKKALDKALFYGDAQQLTAYCDGGGSVLLRKELARYLEKSRGVRCHWAQIIIGSSTQSTIDQLLHLFSVLQSEVRWAMENPGYDGVRDVLQNHGLPLLPISVDADGLHMEELQQSQANLVYVTPSHQFPTGAVLSIAKRLQLIRWTEATNSYILEDDYDSELRYSSMPIPSMQGLDHAGRVIYLGTFSKALAPGLRINYLILPEHLQKTYQHLYHNYHNTAPALLQNALAIMMAEGDWDRHLRKMCQSNKKKHDLLIELLEKQDQDLEIQGKGAGLHIILTSKKGLSEKELIERAEQRSMKVYPVSNYYHLPKDHGNSIMVGFGCLTLEQIPKVVDLLLQVFQSY